MEIGGVDYDFMIHEQFMNVHVSCLPRLSYLSIFLFSFILVSIFLFSCFPVFLFLFPCSLALCVCAYVWLCK